MKYDATRSAAGEWSVTSFALRADSALPDEAKQTEALDKHLTAPDYNAGTAGKYKLGFMHYTIEADRAANERMQAIADKLLASVAEPMAARGEWHFYITKANLFPLGFSTGHAVFIEDKLYHATDGRDDLLAGILAYHMADILEKEDARAIVRRRRGGGGRGGGAGWRWRRKPWHWSRLPALAWRRAGGILAEAKAFESPEALIWAQDDRVAMRLLSDAGYDPVSLPLVLRIAEKPADEVDGWDSKPGLFYSIAMAAVPRKLYSRAEAQDHRAGAGLRNSSRTRALNPARGLRVQYTTEARPLRYKLPRGGLLQGDSAMNWKHWLGTATLGIATVAMAQTTPHQIYDVNANAHAEVTAAIQKARAENKRVILDFGGNWCGDCKVLDINFHKPENQALLDRYYVLVDIDVGKFDKNEDIAEKYGVPA